MMNVAHMHWILDMAVVDPLRLGWLLPAVKTQHLNAKPIPGFRVNDYAALIGLAKERELLELISEDQTLNSAESRSVLSDFAHDSETIGGSGIYIRLTEQGGRLWEQMATPQWDRFFYYSFLLPDRELRVSATVASINEDIVVAYLGWLDRLASVDVNWETLKIKTSSNFAATYWKRLDGIHEATVDGLYHLPERSAPSFVSDWAMSLNEWRLRPWDRPDWPGRK
jgi:hypothetical protein